jgi:cellulose synthase/poly-beta-1,6-N-acetylglucosamine synthase-like glycosyltransferase
MVLVSAGLLILQAILLIPVGYLLFLSALALRMYRTRQDPGPRLRPHFAVLIPAHNEESLLPETLESILASNYPKSLFDVYVIADHCSDNTAARAGAYDVNVLIRDNLEQKGKGYALNWCYRMIRQANRTYDAYVFIDADTIVEASFLSVMAATLSRGARAIQAYYTVKNPQMSWNTSLRYVALSVLHYLRPLGRVHWGGSAGLKGNGMVFTQDVLDRHSWSGSITEDIEYHMTLILDGIRVEFAPQAVVYGEMPETFSQSRSQLDRWEQGRLQMALKYIPLLLRTAQKHFVEHQFASTFLYLDACMEHVIPPFSVLFAVTVAGLGGATALFAWTFFTGTEGLIPITIINLLLGLSLVLWQALYLFAGLRLAGAPTGIYQQLLYSPWFIALKLKQYLKILFQRKSLAWVKTQRNKD